MPRKHDLDRIRQNRFTDPSYAHVLMHGAARIYNHTPHNVREARLQPFVHEFPELVERCLSGCSQFNKGKPLSNK